MPDFLDSILEPKTQPADATGKGNWLVTEARCKSSKEFEECEREYLKRDLLPIPFYNAAGELEEPTKDDVAQLKTMGITVDEYRQLVGEST